MESLLTLCLYIVIAYIYIHTLYINHHDDHPESHTKNEGHCISLYLTCLVFSVGSKFAVSPGSQSSAKAYRLSVGKIEVLAFATLFFPYICGHSLEDAWDAIDSSRWPIVILLKKNWYWLNKDLFGLVVVDLNGDIWSLTHFVSE